MDRRQHFLTERDKPDEPDEAAGSPDGQPRREPAATHGNETAGAPP